VIVDQKVILITTTLTASGVYTTHSELDLTPEYLKTFLEEHMQVKDNIEGLHLAHGEQDESTNT